MIGEMGEKCSNCGKSLKVESVETFGTKDILKIVYCPKCESPKSVHMPSLSVFRGKALKGIDKRTGEFRLKVEGAGKKDIMVKTFPRIIVTKPSEWRSHGRRTYKTVERTAKVYPELKRDDEVIVAGFASKGLPLITVMMKNLTIGMTSQFVVENIKLKKGFLSSFTIKNPILVESEKLVETV